MNDLPDDTSEALMAAAHALLTEHGPEALTVRRIATEAGMSTMNVYSRFGGKDGVVDRLYVAGFTQLFAAIDAVPESDDAEADIFAMAVAYRSFAHDQPSYYSVMFRTSVYDYSPSAEASQFALSGLTVFTERVDDAQRRGAVTTEYDAGQIAASLWATCHGLVSLELAAVGDELVDWSVVFDAAMRTTLRGLRPTRVAADRS